MTMQIPHKHHLLSMIVLQDKLNSTVNPNWLTAGFPWMRAIMVEAVEALDHVGWKWWKAPPQHDADQVKLEMIDIWHFVLSNTLVVGYGNHDLVADLLVSYFVDLDLGNKAHELTGEATVQDMFEMIAGSAGAAKQFNGAAFIGLMNHYGMSWEDLYKMYVGKNVLNMFRQANGYKDGTYIKTWFGREDNEVLAGIMDANPNATPEDFMAALEISYRDVVPQFVQPA